MHTGEWHQEPTSTGFLPFELLYVQAVRGPIDVLKETWKESKQSNEGEYRIIYQYRKKFPRCLSWLVTIYPQQKWSRNDSMTCTLGNDIKNQEIKYWYILLPSSYSKLLAGSVAKALSEITAPNLVNYKVGMYDRKKCRRILHVNMLKKWH